MRNLMLHLPSCSEEREVLFLHGLRPVEIQPNENVEPKVELDIIPQNELPIDIMVLGIPVVYAIRLANRF